MAMEWKTYNFTAQQGKPFVFTNARKNWNQKYVHGKVDSGDVRTLSAFADLPNGLSLEELVIAVFNRLDPDNDPKKFVNNWTNAPSLLKRFILDHVRTASCIAEEYHSQGRGEDLSYNFWYAIAHHGDWYNDTVPALETMPYRYLERYLNGMSDRNSRTERLKVISTRKDFSDTPVGWLIEVFS